jgi:hypothetical protein
LAEHTIEVEDTAQHLGLLLLQAIELVTHLASVQAGQRELQSTLNSVVRHAYNEGISIQIPSVDLEVHSRRTQATRGPSPSGHLQFNEGSLPRTTQDLRYQTQRLGLAFSNNPAVLSDVVHKIRASHSSSPH